RPDGRVRDRRSRRDRQRWRDGHDRGFHRRRICQAAEGELTMLVADRYLWLTADRAQVVEDGDPAAAFLLASPGTEIPAAEAERLGLTVENGKVVPIGSAPAGKEKPPAKQAKK